MQQDITSLKESMTEIMKQQNQNSARLEKVYAMLRHLVHSQAQNQKMVNPSPSYFISLDAPTSLCLILFLWLSIQSPTIVEKEESPPSEVDNHDESEDFIYVSSFEVHMHVYIIAFYSEWSQSSTFTRKRCI